MTDPLFRALVTSSVSMSWNLIYALFNLGLGAAYRSFWFISMAAYYVILGVMRLYAVSCGSRGGARPAVMRRCGFGMTALGVALSGIICMAIAEKHNPKYHIVVMIAVAAFTFYLVVQTILNTVKAHKKKDGTLIVLRNISLASVIGSVLSLERSMLGTFGDAGDRFSSAVEAISGAAAFLLLSMGLWMIRRAGRE